MSILDDAIREHLELKRAHGADDAELKRLEDEAFGPPARPDQPDPLAEAPTEFLVAPGMEGALEEGDSGEGGGRRAPNIADLQEAPPVAPAEAVDEEAGAEDAPSEDAPEEEHPAGEHEAVAEPGPSTEERHAIASQPTEIFDVEGQFEDAATEAPAPTDEELVDAELSGEPRIVPAAAAEDEDEFDEFFSEQRLSDELNQALEAPLPDEPGAVEEEPSEEYEIVDVPSEEYAAEAESDSAEHDLPAAEQPDGEDEDDAPVTRHPQSGHDDLLEDTPEFLEDGEDDVWFEQKPPKDIDFGD